MQTALGFAGVMCTEPLEIAGKTSGDFGFGLVFVLGGAMAGIPKSDYGEKLVGLFPSSSRILKPS